MYSKHPGDISEVARSRTPLNDVASEALNEEALLRLKIAAWQSTFPEYLPAPYELDDVRDRADLRSG